MVDRKDPLPVTRQCAFLERFGQTYCPEWFSCGSRKAWMKAVADFGDSLIAAQHFMVAGYSKNCCSAIS